MQAKADREPHSPRLRVVVVCGSIGGLATGLALRSIGCEVEVFERSPHDLKDRGAGLVVRQKP